MLGAGWIVASFRQTALMLSATHIFSHIVKREQIDTVHPSTPDQFRPIRQSRRLHNTDVYALYRAQDSTVHVLNVRPIWHNNEFDVAACCVYFPDETPADQIFPYKFAIDSSPPKVGTPIAAITFANIKRSCNVDYDMKSMEGTLSYYIEHRQGNITDVYTARNPAYRWPGFHSNIPFDSGMSGSPIINLTYDKQIVVCGIISSDFSDNSEATNKGVGCSFATALWPAMMIQIDPGEFGITGTGDVISLLDLERYRHIDDRAHASDHLHIGPEDEHGQATITWR